MPHNRAAARVLVVDDDEAVAHVFKRVLERYGYDVVLARNGVEATERLETARPDVIVSDISMPDMNGIELLARVRDADRDLPVVLVTGEPDLETAIRAVELGAARYLRKPVSADALVDAVATATQFGRLARVKRKALALVSGELRTESERVETGPALALALQKIWMAYQPIVSLTERRVLAYEAFVRSEAPALREPVQILRAAERLGAIHDVGRSVRRAVASGLERLPDGEQVFVNLHPADLEDEDLYDPRAPLSRHATRVVLELTERAKLGPVRELRRGVERLRGMGYRLAVDDLGAGYAGLNSLVSIRPEVVKLDMALVSGVDEDATRRNLVRSMASACRDIGVALVAEGVETRAERETLEGLGVHLLQGYLFGRPDREFLSASMPAFE